MPKHQPKKKSKSNSPQKSPLVLDVERKAFISTRPRCIYFVLWWGSPLYEAMDSFYCLSIKKKGWRAEQRPVWSTCHSRKCRLCALRLPAVRVPGEQAPVQLEIAQRTSSSCSHRCAEGPSTGASLQLLVEQHISMNVPAGFCPS